MGCLGASLKLLLKVLLGIGALVGGCLIIAIVVTPFIFAFNWLVGISTTTGFLFFLILLGIAMIIALYFFIIELPDFETRPFFSFIGILVFFLLMLFLRIGVKKEKIHKYDFDAKNKKELVEEPNMVPEEAMLELPIE